MKEDIRDRTDIERLINTFYDKVIADPAIGYIFTDIARVDWSHHLPVMYDFWEFLLLGGQRYHGNPIQKHFDLHQKHPLTAEHFDRWLELFQANVDALFSGPKAEEAKFRAFSIAEVWKPKFSGGYGLTVPDAGRK